MPDTLVQPGVKRRASHKCQGPRGGGREAPGMSAAGLQGVCVRERACVSARACVFVYKRVHVQVMCVCVCRSVCE